MKQEMVISSVGFPAMLLAGWSLLRLTRGYVHEGSMPGPCSR